MRFTEVFTALTLAALAVAHPSAPKDKKGLATAMKARGREFIGTALTLYVVDRSLKDFDFFADFKIPVAATRPKKPLLATTPTSTLSRQRMQ
jgi:hypothetical protein